MRIYAIKEEMSQGMFHASKCTSAKIQYPNPPGRCYHIVAEAPVLRRHLTIGYEVMSRCLSSQPATPCVLSFWRGACERGGLTGLNLLQSSMAMFGRVIERIIASRT